MRCIKCGKSDDWVESRTITNIDVRKDENSLLCICGSEQDAFVSGDEQ